MNEIPIFDSLTHPMPNGNWLHSKYNNINTIERLLGEMNESNVKWGFAVGMGSNIGGYNESDYSNFIRKHTKFLFPIAYMEFQRIQTEADIDPYLGYLKKLGYIGIKIHPRFSQITYDHPHLIQIIKSASRINLAVLLCTYCYENSYRCYENRAERLIVLLSNIPEERVILVHGGGVQLLEFAEIARSFTNVLLDLSLTLCKYPGSSLDMDIRFLFTNFDRRICVGSDGPEFTSKDLRQRFDHFSQNISLEKVKNIAYKNIKEFTNLQF